MCRLSAFFGHPICAADLVTRPSRSIITQSFDARERVSGDASTPAYLNGDGFGLGWYSRDPADVKPCVYKQVRPAWNDPNLSSIAEKIITPVLFAHVRAASPGMDVSETTCHPFRFGRYIWMHNGGVANFRKVRKTLLKSLSEDVFDFAVSHGSSDTALCFAVFLNLVPDPMAKSTPNDLRKRLEQTIRIVQDAIVQEDTDELSLLNFVVSDGDTLAATRYAIHPKNPSVKAASLYYASGNSYTCNETSPGSFSMVHTSRQPTLAIISSEPLTEERADWVSVPQNHTIVITESMHIAISPIVAEDNAAVSKALNNLVDFPGPIRKAFMSPSTSMQWLARSPGMLSDYTKKYHPSFGNRGKISAVFSCAQPLEKAELDSKTDMTRFALSIPARSIISMTAVSSFLCFGMDDGSIRLYNLDDSTLLPPVQTSHGAVMALLGDDKRRLVVSACSASTVCLWRILSSGQLRLLRVISCDEMGVILGVCYVGKSVFAGFSDTYVRCVVEDIDTIPGLFGDDCPVPGQVTWKYGSASDSDPCEIPISDTVLQSVAFSKCKDPHFGYVFALASCAKGKYLVSGCGDGIVRVWDRDSGNCKFHRDNHGGAVSVLSVYEGEGGELLFSGSRDQTIKVWDVASGFICKRTLRKHKTDIVFLAVSNGRLYSGSSDGVTHVWCAETLRHFGQCRDTMLSSGAVSACYQLLFTASNEGLILARDTNLFQKKAEKVKKTSIKIASGTDVLWDTTVASTRSGAMRVRSPSAAVMTLPIRSVKSGKVDSSGHDYASEDDATTLVYGLSNDLVLTSPHSSLIDKVSSPRALRLSKKAMAERARLTATQSTEAAPKVLSLSSEVSMSPEAQPSANKRPNGSFETALPRGDSSGTSSSDDAVYVEIGKQELERELAKGESATSQSIRMLEERLLQDVLARFVSFATVSGVDEYREDCWQGARYIGSFLEGLGASVNYVATSSGNESTLNGGSVTPSMLDGRKAMSPAVSSSNPIVLARFAAAEENAPTLTFYGHYDVMPADSARWDSNPWNLTPLNGRYYGRGVTDNKGPILAMIFAIKKILNNSKDGLAMNIVLVLEGEGEMSNKGFRECIDAHRQWFEGTSLILTSNSYWLGEERPCITYGMRGVVDLQVSVSGPSRNLHSGVDGGAVFEPVADLLAVVGTLVDASGTACVPGFYDDVRPLSEEDKKRLADVEFDLEEYRAGTGVSRFASNDPSTLLEMRWRRPSISVTSLETSNTTGTHSVVPREAMAKLSIRYVPDQSPNKIEEAVRKHLEFELRRRRSPNKMKVVCVNSGDSWLGDPSCEHFQIAAKAVREVWGVEPQYVCEGGTMPIFSFLSKELDAPIVQVPLGQSSDGAHLPNERIRIVNLQKGMQVLQKIIEELCESVSG